MYFFNTIIFTGETMKQKIIQWAQNHKTLSEILRFCIVGGLATVIDMIVMGVVLYIFQHLHLKCFHLLYIYLLYYLEHIYLFH